MTQYYEKSVTRQYQKEWMDAWVEAEASLGLKNSFFLIEDGMVTQYVDGEEAEAFHKMVKNMKDYEFDILCNNFEKEIKKKKPDKVKMFKALTIFDEMDNYDLGNDLMKARLKEVRESTHEIPYKI